MFKTWKQFIQTNWHEKMVMTEIINSRLNDEAVMLFFYQIANGNGMTCVCPKSEMMASNNNRTHSTTYFKIYDVIKN